MFTRICRFAAILIIVVSLPLFLLGQQSVKNVILLIPDGTSSDVLSLARWYQGNRPLTVDGIICGMIKTNSVDSTIADSAPTSTAYATGGKTKSGYIGMMADSTPRISVLELAHLKGLSTGVVFTCQFPHATPADFVCHHYNRNAYDLLAKQFVFNSPDVVFGGGYNYLSGPGLRPVFDSLGLTMITDYQVFKKMKAGDFGTKPSWALFNGWMDGKKYLSYDCDRDSTKEPSLAEMTDKAIQVLSRNKSGFFLMVEGSQVDWAAHDNDPKGVITDFLAYDKAVKVALDFAKKDKNTVVIVCPDHGNGGITMGSSESNTSISYDKVNIYKNVITPLKEAKHSARWVYSNLLNKIDQQGNSSITAKELQSFVKQEYRVQFTDSEAESILNDLKLIKSPPGTAKVSGVDLPDKINTMLVNALSKEAFIGWTSTGHTGEDVFMGIYHPGNDRLTGIVDNTEIAGYIAKQLRLGNPGEETKKYFMPVSSEKSASSYSIQSKNPFVIRKGNDIYELMPNVRYYKLNSKTIPTRTLVIQSGSTYYVPDSLYNSIVK